MATIERMEHNMAKLTITVDAETFARISPDASAPHYDLPDGRVKVPAAYLIDRCGLKGASVGGAAVYERQPLVIVNLSGDASPETNTQQTEIQQNPAQQETVQQKEIQQKTEAAG